MAVFLFQLSRLFHGYYFIVKFLQHDLKPVRREWFLKSPAGYKKYQEIKQKIISSGEFA